MTLRHPMTDAQRDSQRLTLDAIRAAWPGVDVVETRDNAASDAVLNRDGTLVAFAECKGRPNHTYDEHPDLVMLSWIKTTFLFLMAEGERAAALAFLRFRDGEVRWADLNTIPLVGVSLDGRKDRNDPLDWEACAHFRLSDWKPL